MAPRLGIGVITFNRREIVDETIERVLARTRQPFCLVVADDGSEDGTADRLRGRGITIASGRNRGIAWNKNRALFYLLAIQLCDVAILLEDDTHPAASGWEGDWCEAAQRWGHVNIAGRWFQDSFIAGAGSPETRSAAWTSPPNAAPSPAS